MRTLADLHPKAILEIALTNDVSAKHVGEGFFGRTNDQPRDNSYSSLNDNVPILLNWVSEKPEERAPRLARYVSYFKEDDQGSLFWSPIAEELIKLSGVALKVLNVFYFRFDIGSGSGLWSDRLFRRRTLLTKLTSHADESVRSWAKEALIKLDAQVAQYRDLERTRDERFE